LYVSTGSHTKTDGGGSFGASLARLEARALEIQLGHFRVPPEHRGRLFYALELAGEVGELLNGCKKFIRTRLAQRRCRAQEAVPDEAADVLISLMMLKLAACNRRETEPAHAGRMRRTVPWLHGCLSDLASSASRLYAREQLRAAFSIGLYRRVVGLLLAVAAYFSFDLEAATNTKLSAIVTKVQAGYYD
jgi:NTP pyrophosphatase (non-canonical NTP hydrolase)